MSIELDVDWLIIGDGIDCLGRRIEAEVILDYFPSIGLIKGINLINQEQEHILYICAALSRSLKILHFMFL